MRFLFVLHKEMLLQIKVEFVIDIAEDLNCQHFGVGKTVRGLSTDSNKFVGKQAHFGCSQTFLNDFSAMICYDINITKRKDRMKCLYIMLKTEYP